MIKELLTIGFLLSSNIVTNEPVEPSTTLGYSVEDFDYCWYLSTDNLANFFDNLDIDGDVTLRFTCNYGICNMIYNEDNYTSYLGSYICYIYDYDECGFYPQALGTQINLDAIDYSFTFMLFFDADILIELDDSQITITTIYNNYQDLEEYDIGLYRTEDIYTYDLIDGKIQYLYAVDYWHYENLAISYEDLYYNYEQATNDLETIETNYQNLQNTYTQLNTEYATYIANHRYTNNDYNLKEQELENYKLNHSYTNSEYEALLNGYEQFTEQTWLYNLFDSLDSFLDIEIIGTITIGNLLLVPLVFGIIALVLKLIG